MEWADAEALNTSVRAVAMRHRALAAAALAELGLSPGQEIVLLELDRLGPRTQSQLAAAAGCEPPTMTMAVRKLEAAQLVVRTPSTTDGRAVVVDLTPAGRALLPHLRRAWVGLAERAVAGLDPGRVDDLRRSLTEFARSLGAQRYGGPPCPEAATGCARSGSKRSGTTPSDARSAVSEA
jgi:DNA-binding MarR family transcriptional regulator